MDGKEMGGTYFHGICGHPLYEYASQHNIVGAPFTRGVSISWIGAHVFFRGGSHAIYGRCVTI